MPRLTSRRASAGFSLVEIMVGIVVGLFVLVGLSSVYVNSVRGGRTTTASNQLNQELRALMDIMVNDIRRAGYWSLTAPGVNNAFDAETTQPRIDAGCILYSYDNTARVPPLTPGVPGPEDRFGFRLDGGVVHTVTPGELASTATACADASWEPLTDAVSTEVTVLTFDTIGSECLALVPATYVATDPLTYKHWETTAGAGPACAEGAPGAPSPYPDPNTHQFVETRQINIRLTGRSRTDPGLPPLAIEESVLIRANRVIPPTAP